MLKKIAFFLFLGFGLTFLACAQTADQAWLKYDLQGRKLFVPIAVRALGASPQEKAAVSELNHNLGDLAGERSGLSARAREALGGQTVLGTVQEMRNAYPNLPIPTDLEPEGYWTYWNGERGDKQIIAVVGADPAGVLYGTFALLRFPITGPDLRPQTNQMRSHPTMPIRWTNEWNNLNGSIERGYAGRSIFFDNDKVVADLTRAGEYARLLASIATSRTLSQGRLWARRSGALRDTDTLDRESIRKLRCAVSIRMLSVWVPKKSHRVVRSAGRGLMSTLCEINSWPSPSLGCSRSEHRAKLTGLS